MDVVIASVHTLFNQPNEQMTDRVLRASKTPTYKSSATLQDECSSAAMPIKSNMPEIFRAAARRSSRWNTTPTQTASTMNDRDLRMAKEAGCKIVINTDSHHTTEIEKMKLRNKTTPPRLANQRRHPQHPPRQRIPGHPPPTMSL